MLGWEIFVDRQNPQQQVARWRTGVLGARWLGELVKEGKATDLGGNNGYPDRYQVAARVLLPILASGPPAHDSPLVIGDDYVLPPGWNDRLQFDRTVAEACDPNEILNIEVWDQS